MTLMATAEEETEEVKRVDVFLAELSEEHWRLALLFGLISVPYPPEKQ